MEAAVLKFYRTSQDRNEKITGNVIKAVALQTAAEMNISPFTASNGWLNSFTKRNGIHFGGGKSRTLSVVKDEKKEVYIIDYDPIDYDEQIPDDEPKYKFEEVNEEEEVINWRNWCKICSNPDTITNFEPFLYEIISQVLQISSIDGIKICKICHSSLISISKLVNKSKVTEKMFEELEEQDKRQCLTNESIFGIRQQYEEIADNQSENFAVKTETLEEFEVEQDELAYDENKYLVEGEINENSCENVEDDEQLSDSFLEDSYETKPFSRYKKSRKKHLTKISTIDESMYDFTCHICHENFSRMCFLSNHTRKEHDCLPQVACTCGRFLATWDSLMNHKRKHENTGEWACDICGSRKLTKSGLKLHMLFKHLRVKPHHLCTVCGKEFKEISGLKQHERSHLPDEEKLIHECHQCGKRFSQKPTLRQHIRLHTSEKTIICHICSKVSETKC